MNLKKPSLLRRLLLSFLLLGTTAGFIFPFYTEYFVEWKPNMYPWFFLGSVISGVILGGINYFLVNWILIRRLKRISDVASAISSKDVTHICTMQSHDLIGDIVTSFNQMSETLRVMLKQISSDADDLTQSVGSLSDLTSQTEQDVHAQFSQVEQVATAMNQMSASVKEVAQKATETAELTAEANEQGNNAKVVVVEAMGAVDHLSDMVQGAATVISNLEAESENIGNVLAVINGIAEQTNLLALNAAIEAARAGEQGRGFAVVADEVRTLATRTQQSTEEISAMIERLQKGSRDAVKTMEAARAQALTGVDFTEQAAEALAIISGDINSIADMSVQISSAANEQTAVVDDVSQNITAINDVSQHTTQNVGNINQDVTRLSGLAEALKQLTSGYKT